MGKQNSRRLSVKIIGVLTVSLALMVSLAACGNSKEIDAIKKTDADAAKLAPTLEKNLLAAIEAKTKSYTDKGAKKELNENLAKTERSVHRFEALETKYNLNVKLLNEQKTAVPKMKHLHKNEAAAYRNTLQSVKDPTKETVQDRAIKGFDSISNFKTKSKPTAIQNKFHKTYDSKLNGMLSAKLEADKKAQQAKNAAANKAKGSEAKKQQASQNQTPAQSAPQENNAGGQSYGNGGSNGYGTSANNHNSSTNNYGSSANSNGGGPSSSQRPYNPPAQNQSEWQVKPSEKTDANGNYIAGDGSVHNEPDLSEGIIER